MVILFFLIILFFVSLVLILPMRNGNKVPAVAVTSNGKSSYPTYEEWKQVSYNCCCWCFCCSYPTYEEWKHMFLKPVLENTLVLILPMRNGNLQFHFSFLFFLPSVLILPMRNGNSGKTWEDCWDANVLILPMRNGNTPRPLSAASAL